MSTVTPTAVLNAFPSSTLAVLRPTPVRPVSASIVRGTSPPWSAMTAAAIARRLLALLRKKPVDWTSRSSSSCVTAASDVTVGYFRNSTGVTLFTRSSVHCADRIVAISSCNGVV